MIEIFDFVNTHALEDRQVYLASLDIDRAFDTAPRDSFAATLRGLDMDPNSLRFVETWLRSRRF